jgi:hypothetical protein
MFKTDDDCLDYLDYIEAMRWPNGGIGCVHCGAASVDSKRLTSMSPAGATLPTSIM